MRKEWYIIVGLLVYFLFVQEPQIAPIEEASVVPLYMVEIKGEVVEPGVYCVGVNPYGLPSQEVLNLTTGLTIYRTDQDGSIVYDVSRDRFFTTLEYQTVIQGKRP